MYDAHTGTDPSGADIYVSMIFLDTTPCIAGYRENDPQNWDPCSSMYPTCSPSATDDDFEGYVHVCACVCMCMYMRVHVCALCAVPLSYGMY